MSHEATVWAIRQRGLKPAAKLVLWHLADRFHPDHGCFPKQETLAADCELSRSTLNLHLDELEARGLIRREARLDEATKKQLSTRYRLAFERGFRPAETAQKSAAEGAAPASAGHGPEEPAEGQSRVRNPDTGLTEPCPENGESRVRLSGHGYKDEPVSEPVRDKKSAGASPDGRTDAGDAPGGAEGQPGFETFWADWLRQVPAGVDDSQPAAMKAWTALGLDDRREAADWLERWVKAAAAARGKWIAPAASKYLGEMRWRNLSQRPGQATGASGRLAVNPFTRDWWAVLWGRIAAGERNRVSFMLAQVERGAGVSATVDDVAAGRPEALRPCPNDGQVWPAWRDWLRGQGFAVPAFRGEGKVWLWMPGAAPPAAGRDVWTGWNTGERTSQGDRRSPDNRSEPASKIIERTSQGDRASPDNRSEPAQASNQRETAA